mgnify:CR=1 FL=1
MVGNPPYHEARFERELLLLLGMLLLGIGLGLPLIDERVRRPGVHRSPHVVYVDFYVMKGYMHSDAFIPWTTL